MRREYSRHSAKRDGSAIGRSALATVFAEACILTNLVRPIRVFADQIGQIVESFNDVGGTGDKNGSESEAGATL